MPGAPRHNGYRLHQVDGAKVYVHPRLTQVAAQVRVDLGGFWKLRWLKVSGAAPIASCSF